MTAIAPIDTPFYRYGPLNDMLSGVRLFPIEKPPIHAADSFYVPTDAPHPEKFCNKWTVRDIAQTLHETGCFEHWKSRGYTQIWLEIGPVQPFHRHELSVWTQVGDKSELLMHIVVWLEYVEIERLNAAFPVFCVEHLRLQLPSAQPVKTTLPGQDFPSSGMLRRLFGIVKTWACATGAQLITEMPEFFHTAYLFGEYFTFIDPEMEALFQAMKRDLMRDNATLADVSFAFEKEHILFRGQKWLWPTEMQAFGLSHELNQQLRGGINHLMPEEHAFAMA